ncbi:hypothetical protein MF672_033615 [Actinomadura sp. ATCC 31491]|uniref:Uncharacterized protein n=1 Tax=Actinomadura luzonensis TaxID=2805427 RepID=A0ABT0G3J0_9ACTN|nr:hypothetical protein [Actinomadura luzonensis]MCK2218698.1 hypothetical protein [Actinomadura luzonensis]
MQEVLHHAHRRDGPGVVAPWHAVAGTQARAVVARAEAVMGRASPFQAGRA